MGVTTNLINKPFNPRGNDQSPLAYNKAAIYSGKALDFDGVNDLVTGSSSSLPVSDYTIAAWFNLDTLKASGVLTWGDEATSERRSLFVWDGGSGSYYLYSSTYGSNVRGNTPLSVGRWYFGAVTLKTGGEATIYLNGNKDGIGTNTLAAYTGTTYKIGDTGSSEIFDGEISGTRVFNQVLTPAQIADLYNFPEKIVPTGVANTALKLWLPMQEGAGTTAYDGSGNGNHGTISGATYVNGVGAPVSQTAVIDWNKGVNKLNDSEFIASSTTTPNFFRGFSRNSKTEESPFGTFDAIKMTENGTNGNPGLVFVTTGSNSSPHTIKAYIKADAATSIAFATNGQTNPGNINVTTEWQAFEVTQSGSSSNPHIGGFATITQGSGIVLYVWHPQIQEASSAGPYVGTIGTAQTSPVLLPQGLTAGRDITGVNLFTNVRKQGALNLDGNSWAEVHDNASLDFGSGITLECWAQLDDADGEQHIMGKWNYGGSIREYLIYYNNASNQVQFYFGHGANVTGVSFNVSATGQYLHLVGTTNGSTITPYVNGLAGTTATQSTSLAASNISVTIGMDDSHNPLASAKRQIAQPRIYNRALTAEEVQRNYDAGKNIYS